MATTDDMGVEASLEGDALPHNEEALGQRRRRAREILSSQHVYLDRLEDELGERVRQIADEIGRELASDATSQTQAVDDQRVASLEAQLEDLQRELSGRQVELNRARDEQKGARVELDRLGQELRMAETLLAESRSDQEKKRVELAAIREEVADAQAQIAAGRAQTEKLHNELAAVSERIAAKEQRLRDQRQRLASKFKAQSAARLARLDERLAQKSTELDSKLAEQAAEFEKRCAAQAAEFERRQADQAAQFGERQRHELDEIGRLQADHAAELARKQSEQLSNLDQQLTERVSDVQRLEAEVAVLRTELESARTKKPAPAEVDPSATRALEEQVKAMRAERDALVKKITALEAAASQRTETESDKRTAEEMQRRLELAVADLREVKRVNAELEAKLARKGGEAAAAGSSGALNWEAQKERLLASLEADDRDDEEAVEERRTIEGTIHITDQIVAQKDREIAELKRLAGERSSSQQLAASDLLDHDETIRAEREKLQKVQEEWRQRIGQAEIDISVERAKLARERLELEEKARSLQTELSKRTPQDAPSADTARPQRGRWLARLGLKDLDDKS